MRKNQCVILILVIGLFISAPATAEEITIVGTGSGISILKNVGSAFTQKNTDIVIDVPKSIGSGNGIKAVGRDEYVIGRVARQIKPGEMNYGLSYIPFAKMPIVFFINKSVGIKNLSTQQVCDIYSRKVNNWESVGGKNAKIKVVRREDGDSSLSILLEMFPGFKDITITSRSKIMFNDQETLDLVQKKADTIAFGTYGNARNYQVDILDINEKNPEDKGYAYFGTLALIFKEKNWKGGIRKFVEFVTSEASHDAIRNAGGIPFR